MKTGCFSSNDDVFQFGPWLRSLAPKASRKKDSGNSQSDARDEDEDDVQLVAEDFDDFEIEVSNFKIQLGNFSRFLRILRWNSLEVPTENLELKTSSLCSWKQVIRNKAKLNSNDSLVSTPLPSKRSAGASVSIKDLDLNHKQKK